MDLTKIENPDFLKAMNTEELDELAEEIRSFLIHSLSKTGGHIASNLGVVELTIALHYVFDMPKDKIFFDVGHQCYTHKILTGRAKDFAHLRQYGGISGFQRRNESEYDVWEAGHSSTSLSAALGMAIARDLNHENYAVVPVIGDGALTSGMAMEALNDIGYENRNMVIIFNDNNMSISRNIGGMTKGFARMRSAESYTTLKTGMKDALMKSNVGKVMFNGLKIIKDSVRDTVIDRGIFGEFNLDYIGPINGHNIKDLIRVLEMAKEHEGPIVVHVVTKKGKGYLPCEQDRLGIWHGVGPFDIETGKFLKDPAPGYRSWSGVIADAVEDLAGTNEDIVALTPAMMTGSALGGLFAKYPDRCFDCGIAEEHATTMAAGLAISGKRPFLSIYSSFMQRAYDQINHDICRMDLPVVIGIDRAGLVGSDGSTHHGVFDIGILRPLPNMIICQPCDANEARNLLYTAFHQKHPLAIRYPRGETENTANTIFEEIQIGSWNVLYEGPSVSCTVVSYGPDVIRIAQKAASNELNIRVVNARFFKPIDEETVRRLALENLPVIVYETDVLEGGLGTAMLEYANDQGLTLPLLRMGINDRYVTHGAVSQLKNELGLSITDLFEEIKKETE